MSAKSKRGWRVHFVDIGRNKKSWSKDFWGAELDADAVADEASAVLMSNEVAACIDMDKGTGFIGAGFHRVGDLRIEPIVGGES